jgi:hypothetical protein
MRDPSSPLAALAESLKADLENKPTGVTLSLHRRRLTLAYHRTVVLHWRTVGRELVCAPTGWCRKIHTAPDPVQARDITIRLVFEFVRQFPKLSTNQP